MIADNMKFAAQCPNYCINWNSQEIKIDANLIWFDHINFVSRYISSKRKET